MELSQKQIEFANNAVFDGLRAELKVGLQNVEQRKKEDESMKPVNPDREYDINHIFHEVINTLIWAFEKGPVGTATVLDVLATLREQDENLKKLVTEKDLERIRDAVITGVWHVKEFLNRQEKEDRLAQEQNATAKTADGVKGAALKLVMSPDEKEKE